MTQRDPYIVLITGATDGIGCAMAQIYHNRNAHVLTLGRRPLAELPAGTFTSANYCRADLSLPDRSALLLDWLNRNRVDCIDLVIHNAAVGYIGSLAAQPEQSILDTVNVNFAAPADLTRALYPYVDEVDGKFVFVSSIVSSLPCPDYAVYAATKAALEAFVRNLRIELATRGSDVTAQIVRPGATQTGMYEKSGARPDHLDVQKFAPVRKVAAAIVQAIDRGTDHPLLAGQTG